MADEPDDSPKRRKSKKQSSKTTKKKSNPRQLAQLERDTRAAALVSELIELVEPTDTTSQKQRTLDLTAILERLQELVSLPWPTEPAKTLLASARSATNPRPDYRLLWVGGDTALCHVGTGLHKVPLARLQEVFVSFPGRNRMEWLEVIRVLGPFPNVKNVLQGSTTIAKASSINNNDNMALVADQWQVTWDSMLDGTGKELLAGTAENIRQVPLDVYFCSKDVLILAVPVQDDATTTSNHLSVPERWGTNGSNLLILVKEEELDVKLEKYRVAAA